MADPEVSDYLQKQDERERRRGTAWDEQKVAGVTVQESSTTTLPPNSRFAFVKNGNYLSTDEVDTQITHDKPLYQFDLAADDVWVVGGTDRNAYAPGHEFEGSLAFQLSDAPPTDAALLPADVDTLEVGYATLYAQSLTGVPHESFTYSKGGAVLHIENGDADLRVYKDGDVAASLPQSEWVVDPFEDRRFVWDPSKFPVVRFKGDLYGAGDVTGFLRIRDTDGEAHLVELGTVGIEDDPLLEIFNHQMHLRVEASSSVTGSQTASLGPLQFQNRVDTALPERSKAIPVRDVSVSDAPGDDGWTVVRVYRIDIERREASTVVSRLHLENTGQPANAMFRAVHRDFLTFPDAVDPDDDSNWIAPSADVPSLVRETSVEVLDPSVAASDSVTIATFSDDDGQTKIRGEKELTASIEAGGGDTSSQTREGATPVSELDYLVLVAQVGNPTSSIELITPETTQRW